MPGRPGAFSRFFRDFAVFFLLLREEDAESGSFLPELRSYRSGRKRRRFLFGDPAQLLEAVSISREAPRMRSQKSRLLRPVKLPGKRRATRFSFLLL